MTVTTRKLNPKRYHLDLVKQIRNTTTILNGAKTLHIPRELRRNFKSDVTDYLTTAMKNVRRYMKYLVIDDVSAGKVR